MAGDLLAIHRQGGAGFNESGSSESEREIFQQRWALGVSCPERLRIVCKNALRPLHALPRRGGLPSQSRMRWLEYDGLKYGDYPIARRSALGKDVT